MAQFLIVIRKELTKYFSSYKGGSNEKSTDC
jgi:hypothetical protein